MIPKLSGGRLCALRDTRQLSRRAKLVGVGLVAYEGQTWNEIADLVHLPRRTVRRAAEELQGGGWAKGRPPKLTVPQRAKVFGVRPGFHRSRLTVLLQSDLSPLAKTAALMMRLRGDRLTDSFSDVVQSDAGVSDSRTWGRVLAELDSAGWLVRDGDSWTLKPFNLGLLRAKG